MNSEQCVNNCLSQFTHVEEEYLRLLYTLYRIPLEIQHCIYSKLSPVDAATFYDKTTILLKYSFHDFEKYCEWSNVPENDRKTKNCILNFKQFMDNIRHQSHFNDIRPSTPKTLLGSIGSGVNRLIFHTWFNISRTGNPHGIKMNLARMETSYTNCNLIIGKEDHRVGSKSTGYNRFELFARLPLEISLQNNGILHFIKIDGGLTSVFKKNLLDNNDYELLTQIEHGIPQVSREVIMTRRPQFLAAKDENVFIFVEKTRILHYFNQKKLEKAQRKFDHHFLHDPTEINELNTFGSYVVLFHSQGIDIIGIEAINDVTIAIQGISTSSSGGRNTIRLDDRSFLYTDDCNLEVNRVNLKVMYLMHDKWTCKTLIKCNEDCKVKLVTPQVIAIEEPGQLKKYFFEGPEEELMEL